MMRSRTDVIEAVITEVVGFEVSPGHEVEDIGDGAGITRWGQTTAWLEEYGLPIPRTTADARANFKLWMERTRLDVLCDRDDGLPRIAIDFAVNVHAKTAIRAIQRAVGTHADGVLGPHTERAVKAADRGQVAASVLAARLQYYGLIITRHPDRHARWAHGWMNRTAAQLVTYFTLKEARP
jgi:lysozyme family protein